MNITHPRRNRFVRRSRRAGTRPRRGVTALLAMLYLLLISSLAIGFYAATTTQSQVASV